MRAHEKNSVASALFIAYEPERNGREFMRITGHGLEGKVMEVKDYSEMPWYKQSIETGRGQWYEPFSLWATPRSLTTLPCSRSSSWVRLNSRICAEKEVPARRRA